MSSNLGGAPLPASSAHFGGGVRRLTISGGLAAEVGVGARGDFSGVALGDFTLARSSARLPLRSYEKFNITNKYNKII